MSKLHLRQPNNFNGSSSKASAWMDSIQLYLLINETLYDNNWKKITFSLSFIKKGSAATWASIFTKKALALNPPTLGTWNDSTLTSRHCLSMLMSRMKPLHGLPLPLFQKPYCLEITSPNSKSMLPLARSLMRMPSLTSC